MGLISALSLLLMLLLLVILRWHGSRYFWPLAVLFMVIATFLILFSNQVSGNLLVTIALALSAVLLLLSIVWFSRDKHKRSQIKIKLAKAFSLYKYDYRESWLGFNSALDHAHQQVDFYPQAIKALANMVNSSGGKLWSLAGNRFSFANHWNSPLQNQQNFILPKALIDFMQRSNWVVDIKEFKTNPRLYKSLKLNLDNFNYTDVDIFVPLRRENELVAIVGLKSLDDTHSLNWEDHDLLKAAGQQMASYLGLYEATSKIYEQRQLEAFNRVSTFVVHDIKNVLAQLQLISQNANKFGSNPDFIQDAFDTVESANKRLHKMLEQLQKKELPKVELAQTNLQQLVKNIQANNPEITIDGEIPNIQVVGDEAQLVNVILHLDQNAREAMLQKKLDQKPRVQHKMELEAGDLFWHIIDQGVGMSEEFMRDSLFKPFETTKGSAGMGIGVYQCRYLLQSFDGDLIIRSRLGEGTHCTVIMSTIVG